MILKGPEIRERLEKLKGWDVDEGNLKKIFRFKTFKQAVNFVDRKSVV